MTQKNEYPFSHFPNSWFQVALSSELPKGGVLPLRYFGKDLVAFRTESGEAKVLDAHCPHLGAHLGHGGVVEGDHIRCPFHAWEFDGSGQAVKIPYAEKIPPRAKIDCWPVSEQNGILYVWHHDKKEAPTWKIPVVPEVDTDAYEGLTVQSYDIRVHCQEIGENAVDKAHFAGVHAMPDPANPLYEVETDGPALQVRQYLKLGAGALSGVEVPVTSTSHGLGCAILKVEVGPIETCSFINQTPVEEGLSRAWINFTLKKQDSEQMNDMIRDTYSGFLNEAYQQDIPVWENKIFRAKPLVCDGDGPIPTWRKWCRQFYSHEAVAEAAE